VVDLERLLEPVDGLGAVAEDAACVVREHVDARMPSAQVGGEAADVVQASEVGDVGLGAQFLRDSTCLFR